jgi:exodeoxyribonuclease V gamma subunit
MLLNWEQKKSILTSETEEWQALLWCTLVEKNSASYLKSFVSMEEQLPKCNLPEHVERISIFGVSNMPPIYLKFFSIVSKRVPVTLYILEPSPNAVATLTRSSRSSRAEELPLEGEIEAHSTSKNSLVSSLSHVHRTFIEEATRRACADHVYERIEIPTKESCTLLQSVQSDIRNDRPLGLQDVAPSNDDSIRIHICHSPMRELEVLRDHMLLWFTDPTLQPRHIQVMVCDMKTYAPYIEAVFGKVNPKDPHSIPYVLSDRLVLETSGVSKAFVSILALPTSRFKASEVIDLLACEAVRTRFNFSTEDIASIRNLVSNTGIRWGLDVAHRKELSDVEFTDATCWRQGLDRLLMGYAMGNSNDVATKIPNFNGARTAIVPEASVSENDTEILGKLIGFMDRLNWARKKVSGLQDGKKPKKNLSEWSRHLLEIFEAFFLNTNETFADLNPIRDELLSLGKKSQISDLANEAVEFDAVVAYLNGRIKNSEKADALLANKVVFCGLSLCATMPHRMVCVLGLGDGIFPRGDARPAAGSQGHGEI